MVAGTVEVAYKEHVEVYESTIALRLPNTAEDELKLLFDISKEVWDSTGMHIEQIEKLIPAGGRSSDILSRKRTICNTGRGLLPRR